MIWTRNQYIAHCRHEFTGREMFCELFGPLHVLEEEWRRQGATEKEIAMTAFDWDYVLKTQLAADTGARTGLPEIILEDNDEYTISIDTKGRRSKLCKRSATLPLPLEYPVETMEDWLKIKHWYTFSEDRIDIERLAEQKKLRDLGYLTILSMPGGFDECRELLGEESLCIAYYEEPELIEDILNTIANTAIKVIERVGSIVPIDNLIIHEDMAGKSGPLVGPKQVREFIAPYYRRVWDAAKAQGAVLFSQDSDGNMEAVMDEFIACGVQCFFPCEPAAGMDMVQLRERYGKQVYFKGGIDKHVLRRDKDAIRKELEYKMSLPMLGGGTIFALDHRIPNGVTLDNYRYYVNLGREMLGIPPSPERAGNAWRSKWRPIPSSPGKVAHRETGRMRFFDSPVCIKYISPLLKH